MTPFEIDIHVPLVVVGPGVPKGQTVNAIVENIDLCPTLTELGGASLPTSPDGHSLVPMLHGMPVADWRHVALIEHRRPFRDSSDPDAPIAHSANPPSYEALRTENALYVEYEDGDIAYYDLNRDPDELTNLASSLPETHRRQLHDILSANKECRGAQTCWDAQRLKDPPTHHADAQPLPGISLVENRM
jgi:arylsulfatase A-like enzyme